MAQTKIRNSQIVGDGWIEAEETWTYASATTFTISGDKTDKYQKGDKIKLTQTTDKYFYIVGVSYSSPNTTVTITGGSDYTLANAAITSPYYSKVQNPHGFPTTFNYVATWSGNGSMTFSPGGKVEKFYIVGNVCFVSLYNTGGTTAGTGDIAITASMPVTPDGRAVNGCMIRDSTTTNYVPGWVQIQDDGLAYFYKNTYVNWGIGTGRHAKGQITYFF